jgi:hypothetical protein
MNLHIREIPAHEKQAWDELVHSSRQGNVFLLHDFLLTWDKTDPTVGLLRLGCYSENNQLVGAQAIMFKKALFLRLQHMLSIFYASTPILREVAGEQSPTPFEILTALASESRKRFPYLRVEFHPSLTDMRAYLEQKWEVYPQYTYLWALDDLDALLKQMHRKSSYVRKALRLYTFGCEAGLAMIAEFLRLYEKTMTRYEWRPTPAWKTAFISRAEWLESQGLLKAYTCRAPSGDIMGIALYILSRLDRTVYAWLVGYDPQLDNKEFLPAIDYYAAQCLASEFSFIDFGEGTHPSLYAFKDSLGGCATPFWILKTRNATRWLRVYETLKRWRYAWSKSLAHAQPEMERTRG